MVKAARTAAGLGALRPLNRPQPARVEAKAGWPVTVLAPSGRQAVISVEDVWRIEEEWWREAPVVRTYFEVLLEGGGRLTLFCDHGSGAWYRQRHG